MRLPCVYYRPGTFRSRSVEWEETVHQDTGLLGFTTKHIYFSGPKKKFRVRYDRIVDFEPYDDGFGLMREAQTAKPQSLRTGDGRFHYNTAVNLARQNTTCLKSWQTEQRWAKNDICAKGRILNSKTMKRV